MPTTLRIESKHVHWSFYQLSFHERVIWKILPDVNIIIFIQEVSEKNSK